jgi:cell wall-associated NlpC family hydrolase
VDRARAGEEPPTTARASAVVSFAAAQIGKRYCWGGTGPSCFDCSGLAQSAWAWAGVHVPRTSRLIVETLPEVGLEEVRAGDILWWPGHVGIYAGNGWMIDALDSRHGVVVRLASDPLRAFRPIEWLESQAGRWPRRVTQTSSRAGSIGTGSVATGGHPTSVQ